jgi:hypothetical protein
LTIPDENCCGETVGNESYRLTVMEKQPPGLKPSFALKQGGREVDPPGRCLSANCHVADEPGVDRIG